MAVLKFGAIITDMKGKLGGQVFQGGNNSKVIRNNSYKKGTSTTARQAANRLIYSVSTLWRGLNDTQRGEWATAALSWGFVDKFGNAYYGNGYQCFMAFNTGRLQSFEAVVSSPNAPVSAESAGVFVISADDATVMDVNWDVDTTVVQNFLLYMTAPTTAGKNPNNLKYRFITSGATNGATSGSCSAEYDAVYGGRANDDVIYFYTEIRVVNYPRAVMRQYGSFVIV